MIPRAFGESPPLSLGVEEELFVVDRETLDPAPVPPELLDGERVKAELFAAVVELTPRFCTGAAELRDQVVGLRARASGAFADHGLALAASGTWPTAVPEEQELTPDPAYRDFADYAGAAARRQFCAGLHVHVGVESAEACMAALEFVLPWLPLLLAVSANSPYLAGRESGLMSTRAEILTYLPRTGAPPAFEDYGAWERHVTRLVDLGLADAYRRTWWDARPHPALGTLEVRMPDQPTDVEGTAAFAALVQALVASAQPGLPADRGLYAENRWAALRFGRGARLVHPDGTRLATVPDLLDELLDRVGPAAEKLGGAELLAPLSALDGAGRQLAAGRGGGFCAVRTGLVAGT